MISCPQKLPIDIDMEAVVCGRFMDLTRALIMVYLLFPERVELILAWCLNIVGENQVSKEIVEGMQELKSTIDAHSESHGHEALSVLSVYILSYVPRFCSLDIPLGDRYSEWVPPPNFNLSCTRRVSGLLPKHGKSFTSISLRNLY